MISSSFRRVAKSQRTLRVAVIQLVIIALVAGLLAVGPRASADAGSTVDTETRVMESPKELGIVANQSDRLAFGTRASSSHAVHVAALLQTCSGSAADTTYTPVTLDNKDELIRSGVASARGGGVIDGHPSLPVTDPGYRWQVTYCREVYTKTIPGSTSCVTVEVRDYTLPGWPVVDSYQSCTTTPATSEPPVTTNTYMSHVEVRHPDAETWVKDAAKAAYDAGVDWDFSQVYWNSSPGYESRQIIGLPTFLAASPRPLGIGEIEFDWAGNGPWPKEFVGSAGPVTAGGAEIVVELAVDLPSSQWQFEDPYGSYECPTAGRLFAAGDETAIRENAIADDRCQVSWRETSVAEDNNVTNDDTIKLKAVQLLYDYTLTSDASRVITELAEEGKLKDGIEDISSSAGEGPVEWGTGVFTTEFNGSSQEFVIGEVQTYQVDIADADLTADQGAGAESPWIQGEANACQKARGWFIIGFFAGPICELVVGIFQAHLAILEIAWDGIQLIGTIAKAVASGLWSLIKGCASMAVDFFLGIKDTAETVLAAAGDPAGTLQEISDTVSLVKAQLSDPETRDDFIKTVLFEFVGELGSLDMILKRDPATGTLLPELQDDLSANDWLEWGGRIACEVIAAFFGGKIKDLAGGSRLVQRILAWMDDKGIKIPTIKIPATIKCVTAAVGFGIDAYEIAQVALGPPATAEPNSFPGHTLVLMADGTHKPIENITIGDQVLSWDEPNQQWEPQTVIDQWSAIDDGQLATATLVDGSTITATDGHLFWVESSDAWAELQHLTAGDELLTPAGVVEIAGVTETGYGEREVWELSVTGNHNFAVYTGTTDVLVHNSCATALGFSNPGGRPLFRQNPDGSVVYDSDAIGFEIDNVLLDADGNPIVIKTEQFEIVYKADGTVTYVDLGPPVVAYDGLTPRADGSYSGTNPDGSQFVVGPDGNSTTLPPGTPAICNSFPTGTQVRMADGGYSTIEDIRPGDQVLSYDFAEQAWIDATVTNQWSAPDVGVMTTATLDDGSTITATDHHRFWSSSMQAWTPLDETDGTALWTPDGAPVVVEISNTEITTTLVWEITVDQTHNFTVKAGDNDLLVHNGICEFEVDADGNFYGIGEDLNGNFTTLEVRTDGTSTTTVELPDGNQVIETFRHGGTRDVTTFDNGSVVTVVTDSNGSSVTEFDNRNVDGTRSWDYGDGTATLNPDGTTTYVGQDGTVIPNVAVNGNGVPYRQEGTGNLFEADGATSVGDQSTRSGVLTVTGVDANGRPTYTSNAGLEYTPRDDNFADRVDHVLNHGNDIPTRPGDHGVFTDPDPISVVDDAWNRRNDPGVTSSNNGSTTTYTIPMGQDVGTAGGSAGNGGPLRSVLVVVTNTTPPQVISAYPVAP
jgi:hypothetical protein